MTILSPNIRILEDFLAISLTDIKASRWKCLWLCFHVAERFCVIFHGIHKKQEKSSGNSGYKIRKICGRKIYSRTRTFGPKGHKSNIRVKRWHNKYESLNEIESFNDFAYQVQSYSALQTYKEEE